MTFRPDLKEYIPNNEIVRYVYYNKIDTPAPPPLECTLQQANVSLPKGMPLNWGYGQKFNGMPLGKLHLLAAVCNSMAAVQVLTSCNLRWWSFSSAIEQIYSGTCGGVNGARAALCPL